MSWFSEQLNKRKKADDTRLGLSLDSLASSIMGKSVIRAVGDNGFTDDAAQEIIRYFGFKPKELDIPFYLIEPEDQLEYILRPYGIMRREVLLDQGWYKHALGPMIGSLKEDDSAVALIPCGLSGYEVIDYNKSIRFRINRKNEDILKREAICFYKPLPMRPITHNDVFNFMKDQLSNADYIFYIIAIAVPVLLGFFTPAFSKWLFGTVLPEGSMSLLSALASFMLGFILCQLFMNIFKVIMKNRAFTKLDTSLRAALMGRILSLKPEFFGDYSAGELAARVIQMESVSEIIVETVGSVGITAVLSFIYIGQGLLYAPQLAGSALTVALLNIVIVVLAVLIKSHVVSLSLFQKTKTDGMTYPMITGIEKIKIAGAEKRMFSRWAEQYSKETAVKYSPSLLVKIWPALLVAVNGIGALFIFSKAYNYRISIDNYYAFSSAFGMVSAAMAELAMMVVFMSGIKPAFDLLDPILSAKPETDINQGTVASLSGNIEFRDVSFTYDEDMPNVLDSLSFRIAPGEYVGIVGKTGCGKSTILRLMLGFETPQKGSVYYDRRDVNKIDRKSLRSKIGSVLQDEKLFTGDIFTNITIAAPQTGFDQAWEAAEIADIADDIRNMPMGMHTFISEGNGGLSGGQKQRLMIARAVVAKPKVLLFDEATSALDNITQKKISEAIDKMDCTRVVVAHRLSTIQNCDRILVMDKGKIAEEGNYEELLAKNGIFAELVERQRIDFAD